jgi:uncharacterized protein YdhG (YjbR/CyaY superfamily)
VAGPGATPYPDVEAWLRKAVKARFPKAKEINEYGMVGWRVQRGRTVEWTTGTVDPNFVSVFLGDRKQGITLHLWVPLPGATLSARKAELEKAGFKVMVGCLQFTRKQPYPTAAVEALLDGIKKRLADDAKATG